jgi:hypothetical protein
MLCLAYKLQRLTTIGNGRQPVCSALMTVNPVCSVSTVLYCSEFTHVELYFNLKHFCLLKYIMKRYQNII